METDTNNIQIFSDILNQKLNIFKTLAITNF